MAKPAAKKTAAKTAAKPAAKVVTITLRQLAADLSETHEISKKDSAAILEDLVTMITKHPRHNILGQDDSYAWVDDDVW